MADGPVAASNILPLAADDIGAWKGRIDRAVKRQALYHVWWEAAKEAYAPSVTTAPGDYQKNLSTNRVFTIVERKKADLFYQKPDLTVEPSPLLEEIPGGGDIAQTHGTILNEKLGIDGVNAKRLAGRAIFDWEMYGAGWTVMGYRAYHGKPIEKPVIDPRTGLPVVDPLTMQPQTQAVPVIVKSECFWESISPKQALIPDDWTSTDFDKAPWLGWKFKLSLTEAKRLWKLPDDFKGSNTTNDTKFDYDNAAPKSGQKDVVTGTQLWYHSSIFREDVVHPDHLTELILLDGVSEPVEHRDCPLQQFDDRGRSKPFSLVGFPMHPLVIREVTDAAYVVSDVAVALPLVNELDKYRVQQVKQRDANLLKWYYDSGKVGKDDLDKAVSAPQNGMIGLPSAAFANGDPIRPMERGTYPPENFTFQEILDTDLNRTHAVDATASGTSAESGLTATEANLRQANVNVRLGSEQGFVADWYVAGATKFSCILQQFLSVEDAAAIVGPAKAQAWDQLRQAIPARFAFSMTPDSSLRNDTPLDRKQIQDLYTFLAKDPSLNRAYLNEKILRKFHLDPTKAILKPEQMPKPEAKPSDLAVSMKDLALLLDPTVLAFVEANPQWGIKIPEVVKMQMIAMAQQPQQAGLPPHGGKVAPVESLDKHQAEKTGAMNGSGQFDPQMGAGIQ